MNISVASLADVTNLCILVNSAYRGEFSRKGWTTEDDLIGGSRTDELTLQQYIEDQNSVILKVTNDTPEIIGCVHLINTFDHLYLGMLTVSPLLQARGTGKLLMHAAEEQARVWNCKKIIMTVISERVELLNWYKRHGYFDTGKKQPFHADEKFGKPRKPLELLILEKVVDVS